MEVVSKRLDTPRRCHYYVEGFPFELISFIRIEDKVCPNYVNMRKPRRVYWERRKAERVCWAYVCDWCSEDVAENSGEWCWPTEDSGQFKGSMECSLP